MSYSSKYGKRPNEYASKSAHTQIINDPDLKNFLISCNFPKSSLEVTIDSSKILVIDEEAPTPIKYIVAVDGGYDSVSAQKTYPSATIAFFQFGALMFKVEDLISISDQPFIQPEDMQKLKQMERLKLALPVCNITIENEKNLINSVRKTIYNFFMSKPRKLEERTSNFMKTLYWLIFYEFLPKDSNERVNEYILSNCPCCQQKGVILEKEKMRHDYTFTCSNPNCQQIIYLTDVFRLHEAIDNELGAGGILGYLTSLLEQFVIIDLIRTIFDKNKQWLKETLFIKDGPLGFFGQTANMFRHVRKLLNYLDSLGLTINLVGIEKSGVFVEHAHQIQSKLDEGTAFMLSNDYIYGNILPSKDDNQDPYASTSYYSGKLIYKTKLGQVFVVTIPTSTSDVYLNPSKPLYMNIDNVLVNLSKLKCDMYDNALFPVALANKLVSLSSHPSSAILEHFFKDTVNKKSM
ncbi:DNA double-strand break repair nuclease NurA [Thermaerobacillus caldiproteolyticus]|uniref:NurA domain-containing protein n=1 Tax=Thermaerobacillus caldiproteolyticus TaxID=247480 RepID=A0A7V9Z906_9BACL|nr:DNA double-strand break repair nuclease NurA [Anoxybacillus caldiproteolyticus]MBA2876287.1 hypothetical protein [Anoxybacillus caldiproteolyticus]